MIRKIINVFIASPSDLSEERQELRNVVERLNKVFGKRLNIQIELLGWEDTLPSFTRPQEQINKDVEICDLFIGILWKRWGTPSGKFSSGFEEEFNLARSRKLAGDQLDVWLLFKSVDNDLLQDPGEQLKRIIDFKKEQIEAKELLFKEFPSTKQFNNTIHDDLSAFLLEQNSNNTKEDIAKLSSKSSTTTNPKEILSIPDNTNQNIELSSIYHKLLEKIKDGKESEIDFWTSLRTLLSSFSYFSLRNTGEVFETHKVHYVYIKRKEWTLSFYEQFLLIRSCIANADGYLPSRYWLQNNSELDITNLLENMARYDKNDDVQIGAINFLKDSSYIPNYDFLIELFSSENEKVLMASMSLGKKHTSNELLDLYKTLFESSFEKVRQQSVHLFIDQLYLSDPEKSFKLFAEESHELTELYKQIMSENNLNVDKQLLERCGSKIKETC